MVSKREKAKLAKQERNKRIFSTMMVILMIVSIGSVFLYYGSGNQTKFKETHNNIEYQFELNQDDQGNYYYQVRYDDTQFLTYFPASQLRQYNMDENSQQFIQFNPTLALSFNPNSTTAQILEYIRYDVRNNAPIDVILLDGITQPYEGYVLPIITCENASSPVIILQEGNQTLFDADNTCLTITIGPTDYLRVRDMIVYLLHGVEL